jgi:multiple sugar transport system ATP-binding protein
MSVEQNIGFSLRMAGLSKPDIEARVAAAARTLQIEPLLKRKPAQLSGGQRQRVAIGRAIVRDPEVFLFDEPLSNLDAELRVSMRVEIAKLHNKLGSTMIYVTHDQTEAMTLADKIVVMNLGRIEQVGSPRQLFETPANTFVATFIGSPKMALIDVTAHGGKVGIADGGAVSMAAPVGETAFKIGVRPDALKLMRGAGEGFAATVVYAEYLGDNAYVYARLADGALVSVRTEPNDLYEPDEAVTISVDPAQVHFFSAADGRRLTA